MKIIKEISKKTGFEDVKKIYDGGHKIAIKVEEDTLLEFTDCILDSDEEVSLFDYEDASLKDNFAIRNGAELVAKKDELIIIDDVMEDKIGIIAYCHISKEGSKDFIADFHLYDDSNGCIEIFGNTVYEVEV